MLTAPKAAVIPHAKRITPEVLAGYRLVIGGMENAELQDALLELCDMVELFHQTPDTTEGYISEAGYITAKLPPPEVQRIWDKVPYLHREPTDPESIDCDKLEVMIRANLTRGYVMDEQDPVKPVKVVTDEQANKQWNAAMHLLWHAVELAQDLQPRTTDLRK